jgi:hypothetical protein
LALNNFLVLQEDAMSGVTLQTCRVAECHSGDLVSPSCPSNAYPDFPPNNHLEDSSTTSFVNNNPPPPNPLLVFTQKDKFPLVVFPRYSLSYLPPYTHPSSIFDLILRWRFRTHLGINKPLDTVVLEIAS